MKTKAILMATAILAAACNNSRQPLSVSTSQDTTDDETASIAANEADETALPITYDPTDAQAFGLSGNVQMVESQVFSTYDNAEGELIEDDVMYTTTMRFDARGHVVLDEWGNEYGYDAEGNYYRGNHIYTEVTRDEAGRIVKYTDEEPNKDDESNKTITFTYDQAGRLTLISQSGWTGHWTIKREYTADKSTPLKAKIEEDYEGGGSSSTDIEYRYSNFDSQGNWQMRLITFTGTVTETEYDGTDIETPRRGIWIERRSITYY